jgi:hypothetical protein
MTVLNKCIQTFSSADAAVNINEKKGRANKSARDMVKKFQPPVCEEDLIFCNGSKSWLSGGF